MNYQLFEKALIKPIIQSNAMLAFLNQIRRTSDSGLLYTLRSKMDGIIKIGFTNNLQDFEHYINSENYTLVGKKSGTERELRLLSLTLEEIGYKPNNNGSTYNYSNKLIRHLALLGWPTGDLKKGIKKKTNMFN